MPRQYWLLIASCTLAACQPTKDARPSSNSPSIGLAGTSWQLVEIQSMDDAQGVTKPADPTRYTISFGHDGKLLAQLDCNRGTGPWKASDAASAQGSLELGPLATTKMMCPPPSIGNKLASNLGYVRSFMMKDGRLYLSLMADGGILVWEPPAR